VFGASQLPKLARSLGQAQREFKNGMGETPVPAEVPVDKPDSSH
jgi:Sec-independent protein translocase protein TatA